MVLAAVVVAGTAMRYQRRVAASPTPVSADKVTVRFFKNPAAAPAPTLQTIDGRTISAAELHGKVTLINFWATWCPPCKAEIPDLIALQNKYRDQLQVIGISEDEGSPDAVKRFVADHQINYPVVMTTPELERLFPGVAALPTSFIVDRDGRIVQKHVGMLNATTTEAETRVLAGLRTDAAVEYVEPDQAVGLVNAAQAKEIPGIDLARLTPSQRTETLQRLNAEPCTCGCGLTVAKCRIDDPTCGVSLPIARRIADEIAARP